MPLIFYANVLSGADGWQSSESSSWAPLGGSSRMVTMGRYKPTRQTQLQGCW